MAQRVITDSTYCECCVRGSCISGENFETKNYDDADRSECRDYLTASTDRATKTGMYECSGRGDDGATIEWPTGYKHYDGSLAGSEGAGPCFGVVSFSFTAYITEGSIVRCTGESWAGPVGCSITCCYISAP